MVLDAVVLLYDVLAPDWLPFLLLGVLLPLDKGLGARVGNGSSLGSWSGTPKTRTPCGANDMPDDRPLGRPR